MIDRGLFVQSCLDAIVRTFQISSPILARLFTLNSVETERTTIRIPVIASFEVDTIVTRVPYGRVAI